MKVFQNYHRHAMYTNVRISDSAVTPKDYAERAKALRHGILSSAEHGWQGNYFETVRLAKEYGLKPLIGAEAYWVKDRTEKDRTNCHIFLGAKNERGRQALNDVLSEANLTGFYGQPRLDVPLLLSLPKDDLIVTTACIAYWRYENIEEITAMLEQYKGITRCRGVVLGISGGKDSTVVAMLAKKVWGDNVLGILMPNHNQSDINDALDIVNTIGIKFKIVNIGKVYDSLLEVVEDEGSGSDYCNGKVFNISQKAHTNIPPRIRMTVLYAIAQTLGYRVIGTGNASEAYIGWTTKWGDSAYDFNPIAHLTCTIN